MREERSRKINYISKVKIEFGEGGRAGNARLFLFGVALPLQSPGNGRNFKRKFTNEGDFPSLPSPAPTRLQRGRGEGKIAPRGVVFRAFSTGLCPAGRPPATFLEYLSFSFFFFPARSSHSFNGNPGGEGGRGTTLGPRNRAPSTREEMRFSRNALFNPRSLLSRPPPAPRLPPPSCLFSTGKHHGIESRSIHVHTRHNDFSPSLRRGGGGRRGEV